MQLLNVHNQINGDRYANLQQETGQTKEMYKTQSQWNGNKKSKVSDICWEIHNLWRVEIMICLYVSILLQTGGTDF
jgi:hypothetical protein